MIVIICSLVIVQLLLAGVFALKPSFKAGYYTPPAVNLQESASRSLSERRRRELEAILSPAPRLAWTEERRERKLPEDGEAAPITEPADRAPLRSENETASIQEPSNKEVILNDGDILQIVPEYLERFPDLKSLSIEQRKERFVEVMLPLILRANIELAERRKLIEQAIERGDAKILRQWAELYRLETDSNDIEELEQKLLLRVDEIPVSIALAQSAIESGWGTSRFAVQGNAVFGQWAWSPDAGIKPNDSNYENVVVRSFANIFDSVRAYMHNLNTHELYNNFRRLRQNEEIDIRTLASTLSSYSEERQDYIAKVRSMIEANNFRIYDNAVLLSE
jgi:uncharacterized FlgJ-related protein